MALVKVIGLEVSSKCFKPFDFCVYTFKILIFNTDTEVNPTAVFAVFPYFVEDFPPKTQNTEVGG